MNLQQKCEQEQFDKKSQSSAKLSKTRKIRKPHHEKQKLSKITSFFKKLNNDNIQRPRSSQKKEMRRSPEEQEKIEELKTEESELQHEEEMLKKEIQTVKLEEQLLIDDQRGYLMRLRHVEVNDIKQRYDVIRRLKAVPQLTGIQVTRGNHIQINDNANMRPGDTLEMQETREKIHQKQQFVKNADIPSHQRIHITSELRSLQSHLSNLQQQYQQHTQRQFLLQKQKTCKFAKMNWPLIGKKYQTLELLGCGGYSQVYKAYHITRKQIVALKLCSVAQMAQVQDEVYLKHLFRECQTHKKLCHENIVKLYDVIEMDPMTFCMVLQYCQGPQLSKYLKQRGPLPQPQAKSIMFQIFQALFYLNTFSAKKIIHYDLKPQNIMFHNGLIKILDFGLNKMIDEEESRAALTSAGMGTHAYLPPEIHSYGQNDDRVVTCKVDVWSAGIVFYELLTGQRPTRAGDVEEFCKENGEVAEQTVQIIKGCLKLNPKQRFTPQEVYFHRYFDGFQRKYERK